MKSFKYTLIASLALSAALCACSDDNDYAPGASVAGDEIYLPISQSATIDIPESATSIDISVMRIQDGDDVTANVASTVTDSEGQDVSSIFTVPTSVTFTKGQKEAPLTVGVDFSKVVPDEAYTLTVKLEGDNTTPYGASSREYTLIYSPWSEWDYVPGEIGVYTMTQYTSGEFEVPVLVKQSMVKPTNYMYGVCDLFYANTNEADGPLVNFTYTLDTDVTVEIDGVKYPRVAMELYIPGLENGTSGIKFVFTDVRTWLLEMVGVAEDRVDDVIEANGWKQSYYNPETGTFWIYLVLTGDTIGAEGRYYGAGYETLQLPGYANYEINFSYAGNFVDKKGVETAIVNAMKSDDVASYKCDLFAGKLGEEEAQAAVEVVKSNDDLPSITASSTNLQFEIPEAGDYTVVGVGYDTNGNEVCTAAYSFAYQTVQGGNPWESLGYCQYTDGNLCSLFNNIAPTTWDVEIQQNTETPGVYRLVNPYAYGICPYTSEKETLEGNYYLEIHAEKADQVYFDRQCMGIDYVANMGPIYLWSRAGMLLSSGRYTIDQIAQAGWCGTNVDGVITFPAGSLMTQFESGLATGDFYYGNVDPKNPTSGETFDPFWGEGTFCINMTEMAAAPHKVVSPAKSAAHKSIAGNLLDKAQKVIKGAQSAKAGKKMSIADSKEVLNYFLANPRQAKY